MKEKDSYIANRIRGEIKKTDPKAKVILFGSRARGDAKRESDWDVLVLVDSVNVSELEDSFRDKIFDLELDTGEIISLFVYNKKVWNSRHTITPFYRSIKKEGVQL